MGNACLETTYFERDFPQWSDNGDWIDDNGENYVSVGDNGKDGGGDVMVDGVGVFYKGDNDNKGGDNWQRSAPCLPQSGLKAIAP